ncbi:methyltransferase-like 26 isoform X2 [Diachasmimorpha longicaudata]
MINTIHAAAHHRSASSAVKKMIYPAADRNKDPILRVLKRLIRPGADQTLLEIASGSGQHTAHFAPHFPQVTFYPSEFDANLLGSIIAHTQDFNNVQEPLHIDVSTDSSSWPGFLFKEKSLDYIYCANMIHISPLQCTIGLFKNSAVLLKPEGLLITYGPYAVDGKITPESNVNFDRSLKSQNPEWGLRDVRDLEKLALENNIKLIEMVNMPANNMTLAWKKM